MIRAAEYVRMSTEHQKYSTENQADVIGAYAERHNMEIVRTYSDAGKLIENQNVSRYLAQNHGEILNEFRRISGVVSIEPGEQV